MLILKLTEQNLEMFGLKPISAGKMGLKSQQTLYRYSRQMYMAEYNDFRQFCKNNRVTRFIGPKILNLFKNVKTIFRK